MNTLRHYWLLALMCCTVVHLAAQELTLEVRESNEAALHLYKSCGFRVEAVRKDYYRNPKENALILWKRGFLGIPT